MQIVVIKVAFILHGLNEVCVDGRITFSWLVEVGLSAVPLKVISDTVDIWM
jgi:hypothetical protein